MLINISAVISRSSSEHEPFLSSSSQSSPPALTGFDGVVQEQGNRMRLDSWLSLQLPDHISRARVQNSIRSGLAYVNDQSVNKVDAWPFIVMLVFVYFQCSVLKL